ncbi:MAG: VOC family protein [Rhizobiaceae bacterium]|nr:MAG: VOC family protein [Rhizobiaceae bacterium]
MTSFILNIDVPDVEAGVAFYTSAFGLRIGRRFDPGFVELLGAETRIYLLEKAPRTCIAPDSGDARHYDRHWSPIHPDFVVEDIEAATEKVLRAGATQEGPTCAAPYGQLAMFADPFGHGFCLIEFNALRYDALITSQGYRSG